MTNTYFHTKPCHRVTWRHPRSHHWRHLHVIITKRVALSIFSLFAATTAQAVTLTYPWYAARSRFSHGNYTTLRGKAAPELIPAALLTLKGNINSLTSLTKLYQTTTPKTSVQLPCCSNLRDTLCSIALTAYGRRERNIDWFEACWAEIEPVAATKRKAIINYKHISTRQNLALRAAMSRTQRTVRYCANEYCLKLCENKQSSAEAGDTIGMYVYINKVIGPLKTTTVEIITDPSRQMDRWVEHYLELYAKQKMFTDAALSSFHS